MMSESVQSTHSFSSDVELGRAAANAYDTLAQALPCSVSDAYVVDEHTVELNCSWRDYRTGKMRPQRAMAVQDTAGSWRCLPAMAADPEVKAEFAHGPSGTRVRVRNTGSSEKPTHRAEIWRAATCVATVPLPHGDLVSSATFAGEAWGPRGEWLVYPAMPKPAVPDSWWADADKPYTGGKREEPSAKDNAEYGPSSVGSGALWKEDWGEKHVGVARCWLWLLSIEHGVCVQVKTALDDELDWGQPTAGNVPAMSSAPAAVLAVGWPTKPRRLGMIYCMNRACGIWHINVQSALQAAEALAAAAAGPATCKSPADESGECRAVGLTTALSAAWSPRLHPSGRALFYIGTESSQLPATHSATFSLEVLAIDDWLEGAACAAAEQRDWRGVSTQAATGLANPSCLVPVIRAPSEQDIADQARTAGAPMQDFGVSLPSFPGVYSFQLPKAPWLAAGAVLAFASQCKSRSAVLIAQVQVASSGETTLRRLAELPLASAALGVPLATADLLAVDEQVGIIAQVASPTTPAQPVLVPSAVLQEGVPAASWMWAPDAARSHAVLADVDTAALRATLQLQFLPMQPSASPGKPLQLPGYPSAGWRVLRTTARDGAACVEGFLQFPRDATGAVPHGTPLVLFPHGGPHSYFPAAFSLQCSLLAMQGVATLAVNYRGSTGFGEDYLQALPGKVGTVDVQDCEDALAAALALASEDLACGNDGDVLYADASAADVAAYIADPAPAPVLWGAKVGVMGGSHGGFLSAHLSASLAHLVVAAVIRNPVIAVAAMVGVSDIPDWCYVEAGHAYDALETPAFPSDPAVLADMAAVSPIQHASKVRARTLMTIGGGDRRVPPSQGLLWVNELRRLGKAPTRVLWYGDDSHAQDRAATVADALVHTSMTLLAGLR